MDTSETLGGVTAPRLGSAKGQSLTHAPWSLPPLALDHQLTGDGSQGSRGVQSRELAQVSLKEIGNTREI